MKLLQLLILSSIIVSCGTSKIRYVRTKTQPQQIVDLSQTEVETQNEDISALLQTREVESIPSDVSINDEPIITENVSESVEIKTSISKKIDDRVYAALNAEQKAKAAKGLLISATAIFPTSFIFPPSYLVGLILLIIGAIKYSNAQRSRYITQNGERYLDHSRTFLIISIVLAVLLTLLAAILLVFFFL